MKCNTPVSKTTRKTTDGPAHHSSVDEGAVALAPPAYGIEFVDRGMQANLGPMLQGKFAPVQGQGVPEEEEHLQRKFATVQRQVPDEEQLLQGKFAPVQTGTAVQPDEEITDVSQGPDSARGVSGEKVRLNFLSTAVVSSAGALRTLQPSVGNPAVISPLAGESRAATIQRTQDPDIQDDAPAMAYSGGGYNWPVNFSLPAAPAQRGWIVQEIDAHLYDHKANDGSEVRLHFWESWPVKKNQKTATWRAPNDTYLWNYAPKGTLGANRIDGTARFYTRDEAGAWWWRSWPPGFEPNTVEQAGALGSTTTKPAYWTGGGTDHSLVVRWTADGGVEAKAVPATKFKKMTAGDWNE